MVPLLHHISIHFCFHHGQVQHRRACWFYCQNHNHISFTGRCNPWKCLLVFKVRTVVPISELEFWRGCDSWMWTPHRGNLIKSYFSDCGKMKSGREIWTLLSFTVMYLTAPPRLSGNTLNQNPGLDPIGPPNEKTIVRWVNKLGCIAAHWAAFLFCLPRHLSAALPPSGGVRKSVLRRTIEFVAIEPKAVAIIRTEEPRLVAWTPSFLWSLGNQEKGNWVKFTSTSSLLGVGLASNKAL